MIYLQKSLPSLLRVRTRFLVHSSGQSKTGILCCTMVLPQGSAIACTGLLSLHIYTLYSFWDVATTKNDSVYFLFFYDVRVSFSHTQNPRASTPTNGLTHSFYTRILTSFAVRLICMPPSNQSAPKPETRPPLTELERSCHNLMADGAKGLLSDFQTLNNRI